jgi:hypothetical protein
MHQRENSGMEHPLRSAEKQKGNKKSFGEVTKAIESMLQRIR